MDHGFIRWDNDFPGFIKLHFNLLIDKEDVMYFCIKIRIALFTVILNLEWLDILLDKNLLNPCLCYCFKSLKSSFLCMRLNGLV